MATIRSRPYEHIGLVLPVERKGDDGSSVQEEWVYTGVPAAEPHDLDAIDIDDDDHEPIARRTRSQRAAVVAPAPRPSPNSRPAPKAALKVTHEGSVAKIATQGFLAMDLVQRNVTLVQSIANEKLYANKILCDLDISTWPGARAVLPEVDCFPSLRFWQYCNGGDLRNLIHLYRQYDNTIPEIFIWHVAERLTTALAFLKHGVYPGEDWDHRPAAWTPIYHNDLHPHNVFIHYPDVHGQVPAAGAVGEAFPAIVLADFGLARVQGDEPDSEFLWGNVFTMGGLLRDMAQSHIPVNEDGLQDPVLPANRTTVVAAMSRATEPNYYLPMYVSWTKPQQLMPVVVSPGNLTPFDQTAGADDVEDEWDPAMEQNTDLVWVSNGMAKLHWLRRFHNVRPRYQFRSLGYGTPQLGPVRRGVRDD
ncbi:uncharacterized protein JN550_004070 [Neoarthrinium moseri]|uniref:uncharacterized protein n=1 Tax=Neoarthrinium moseri TaxID=1658444 RepID=UPI001FDC7B82|nr:uncharacterized protein JN550_004070 [Neoarthrinium moseri]KAI1872351.1 hypothetical protein JN550_004070 [Neoarthrinium moseri]